MIASAGIEKLAITTRIDIRGGLAKVEIAAEVSVVAACPCAVDGPNPTDALEAVHTPLSVASRQRIGKFVGGRGRGRKRLTLPKTVYGERWRNVQSRDQKPARLSQLSGRGIGALVAASMIASAGIEKLAITTRIDIRGGLAKVEIAAEVSVVAACPCAVDGDQSTVGICISGGPERRRDEDII